MELELAPTLTVPLNVHVMRDITMDQQSFASMSMSVLQKSSTVALSDVSILLVASIVTVQKVSNCEMMETCAKILTSV